MILYTALVACVPKSIAIRTLVTRLACVKVSSSEIEVRIVVLFGRGLDADARVLREVTGDSEFFTRLDRILLCEAGRSTNIFSGAESANSP